MEVQKNVLQHSTQVQPQLVLKYFRVLLIKNCVQYVLGTNKRYSTVYLN